MSSTDVNDKVASEAGSDMSDLAGKYLTFALGQENYGLEILKVQEIIGVIKVTRVPKTPQYLKGVINLRGKIIPVVDLRLKLGMAERAYDEKTCFIVVNAQVAGRAISVGVVVDTVLEVANYEETMIQPAPEYGTNVDTSYILGLGKKDGDVAILIDINSALNSAADALLSI
jgi:purine-binding chemotaxis protein CheW